ncbi:hypothetical protein U91I_02742 [alpha proteobacterium U9-1i]|nr:hypothetical protein U91I_02742 [alpha proteobacterium U9-1i]
MRRASAAYGLNTCGDYVGFRKKKDAPVAYICCGTGEFTDLDGPDEASNGYYAAAINDHGEIVGTALDRPSVLVWTRTGKLVSSKAVDFGPPLKINNAGQILCSYGIIDGETEFWVPAAPRCTDFTATDINNLGHAVGSGRPLDRHGQTEACLWGPNSTCWNLNDLIDNEPVHLRRATAINDAGWIAADSYLLESIGES